MLAHGSVNLPLDCARDRQQQPLRSSSRRGRRSGFEFEQWLAWAGLVMVKRPCDLTTDILTSLFASFITYRDCEEGRAILLGAVVGLLAALVI